MFIGKNKLSINEISFLFHKRFSLMSRLHRLAYKPRWGWKRKFIGGLFQNIFLKFYKFFPINNFYLQIRYKGRNIPFIIKSKDYQILPVESNEKNEDIIKQLLFLFAPFCRTFIDGGANHGLFSLFLASRYKFNGKIFAFEPNPEPFRILKNIISKTNDKDTISTIKEGLSDSDKIIKFQNSFIWSGYSMINEKGTNKVKFTSLDNFVKRNNLNNIDLIKLDVEDHELEVLKGSYNTLLRDKPFIIFENHPHIDITTQNEIISFFRKVKYKIFIPTFFAVDNKDRWFMVKHIHEEDRKSFNYYLALIDTSENEDFLLERRELILSMNYLAVSKDKVNFLKSIL